jgi:uncharacterized membrane protein YeaQ/YmgE (transglycosylase-associated protein family)
MMSTMLIFVTIYGLPFLGTTIGFLLCDRVNGKQAIYWLCGIVGSIIGAAIMIMVMVSALQGLTRNEFFESNEVTNLLVEVAWIWAIGGSAAAFLGLFKSVKDTSS